MAHANIILSDLHVGSIYGIWPPEHVLDEGSKWMLNPFQSYILECWQHFWGTWIPAQIGDLPIVLWLLGDSIDGVPFRNIDAVTMSLTHQEQAAIELLLPQTRKAQVVLCNAGTEAHTGRSAEYDEMLALGLNARPDPSSQRRARWVIWQRVDGVLIQSAHHISGSMVPSSEATPLMREMSDAALDAGRWGLPMPDVILRGHAHRYRRYESNSGHTVITAPCWQAKAAYVHRMRRASPPDIGGVLIITDGGHFEVIPKCYAWPKPHVEVIDECQSQPQATESAASQKLSLVTKNGRRLFGNSSPGPAMKA